MFSQISLRLYLFIFFLAVGLVPELVFGLLSAESRPWLWEISLLVVLSFIFAWLVARPFQHLLRTARQAGQDSPLTAPELKGLAPAEARELAQALTDLSRRQTEAKMALEERVAERTAELAFSRDLLFKQNIELENLNDALGQRNQENQRLLVETLYRSQELSVLNEISSEALAARGLNTLHPRALDLATRLLEAPIGLIGLLDDKGEKWYGSSEVNPDFVNSWRQTSRAEQANRPPASLLAREALRRGSPLVISDATPNEFDHEPLIQLTGLQSAVYLPLYSPEDKNPLGVLVLGDHKPREWRADEVELMTTVANHLALATSYARLMDEIANERNRFNAVLNGVGEGVVLVDENNRVLFANPAALRNMGLPEDAMLSDYDANTFLSVSSAKGQELAGGEHEAQMVQVERNGRIWGVSINPIHDNTGEFIGVAQVQRDITEAARVDRMKTEFISLVSHELRTPLTSIKGYLELVLDGDTGPINEMQQRFLETARSSSDRLVSLINDLLDVSRIESGKVQLEQTVLHLNRALANVIEPLRLTAQQRDLRIQINLPANLPPAWADRDRVTQILTNLLSNAFKYTRPGGEVKIQANLSADSHFLEIEVSDTGIGMTEEEQQQLFSKFFRSSNPAVRSISGTGLGLTITKSLVEMHGGQMWVRSVLGQGSTFGFSLPVAAVPAAELAPHSYLETQIASGKPKIMIVDAELTTAELLRYHLEIEGFQVGLALDNEEVILRVALEQPDMVVLLPGLREPNTSQMNLPLLYRLKQDSRIRQIPVALLSIVQEGRQTFRLRALTYLTRPVSDKELVGEIAELVGNGYGEPEIDEDSDLGRGLALVANDVPSARFYLDQALQEAGYTTLIASNGAQAVTLARRHRPDLVLLDLNILDYEGLELLQTLKGNCSTAEILGLTTVAHQSGESNYALALVLGTIDFPNKVILADELAARIGKCLLSTANP